jgi:hypothetical protein
LSSLELKMVTVGTHQPKKPAKEIVMVMIIIKRQKGHVRKKKKITMGNRKKVFMFLNIKCFFVLKFLCWI